MTADVAMTAARPTAGPAEHLMLFDGVCNFCDGAVRWLSDHEAAGRLRFAPLQGETAAALRARHPVIPDDIDTMVYVDATGDQERVYLRSEAMFRMLALLDRPWRWLSLLRVLPRWITEPAYDRFARKRYARFGRRDSCRIPTPEERARILD